MPDKTKTKELLSRAIEHVDSGDYNEARALVAKVLEEDPKNGYAYSLLRKIWGIDWGIPSYDKRKNRRYWTKLAKIKCTKCRATISLSSFPKSTKKLLEEWRYDNLEFICPYCSAKNVLAKDRPQTDLWYTAWREIDIINSWSYKIAWCVEYVWKWQEWLEVWDLRYLEWASYDKEWKIIYLSESQAKDQFYNEKELSLSEKRIPDFEIKNLTDKWIQIWEIFFPFDEINSVEVKTVYWENTKKYMIWEVIFLWYFSYSWKNYVIETERSFRQKEVWLYEISEVLLNDNDNTKLLKSSRFVSKAKGYSKYPSSPQYGFRKSSFVLKTVTTLVIFFMSIPVFFAVFDYWFYKKVPVKLQDITENWTYYLEIPRDSKFRWDKAIMTNFYDRWWIRTTYKYNEWIKLKVESIADIALIKQLYDEKDLTKNEHLKELFELNTYKKQLRWEK